MTEAEGSPKKKQKMSTSKTPEEQEEEWREVFQLFDKDKNGQVSCSELGALLRGLGYTPTQGQVEDMVKTVVKNNSKTIEWEDFRAFMHTLQRSGRKEQEQEMLCAFRFFDYNGDGHIDAKELKRVLTSTGEKLSDEEVDMMISVADIDKDGRINYKEFVGFIFSDCS